MGHVHIIRDFASPQEGFTRTVRIYTPDGYDQASHHRFPVLYMHDGQNVFAHPESALFDTWCANLTLEQMVGEGRSEPWLIVAIDSGPGRLEEYSPWNESRANVRARGETYGRFIVETLKPYVDGTYRTRQGSEWTAVMGSSLGGLMSLYLGWKYPEVFGRIGALSPSVMWSEYKLFQHWKSPQPALVAHLPGCGHARVDRPGRRAAALRRGHARLLLPPQAAGVRGPRAGPGAGAGRAAPRVGLAAAAPAGDELVAGVTRPG